MLKYHVVGVMSGTSLDGLDLAFCILYQDGQKWNHEILKARTVPYDDFMIRFLTETLECSGKELEQRNILFGSYIGTQVAAFLESDSLKADLIASHGHTIFHQPEKGFTCQLGSGAAIASRSGITTISDFRSLDVANGGQGAPLVPAGDEYLFGKYQFCLNLGGFANVSFKEYNRRIAFDICPVNIFINHMCRRMGLEFDDKGRIASGGKINYDLLKQLNALAYYRRESPKSLSREWLETDFLPVIENAGLETATILRTACEHIAIQISDVLNRFPEGKVLVTGGGVYNEFLLELIRRKTKNHMEIPDPILIKYKEALVFALLGVLRYRNEINCFASVTGARCDSSTGVIHRISE
ncbi:MAG: anhydro-N-acetylmuramic acid kinase [Bacteroidales bacterium]|nr:anhydro-N-acetylmuramic acid kinase [Bacteroidales bacterium]